MRVEYSLWLMPCASELAELTALVAKLAPEFGESAFIPHVTIQGDIAMDLDKLAAHTKALAAASPVQSWSVASVESRPFFFRCLYLRFPVTPAFKALQKSAQAFTGTASGLSPYPHLSLAYGQMQPRHQPLLDAIKARFMGQLLCFDRIAICRSTKDIPIQEWTCLFDYPLAPLATSPMPAI